MGCHIAHFISIYLFLPSCMSCWCSNHFLIYTFEKDPRGENHVRPPELAHYLSNGLDVQDFCARSLLPYPLIFFGTTILRF
ncbi:hypothetical protein GE09DRAFT_655201 [Coniochaeta sp. 2T2.1]|nr:hypothetical protein GE09DRAFT_655201 [Coniochaeta sp. 2T2.1]